MTLFTSPARSESTDIDALARRKAKKDYHPHKKGISVEQAHTSFDIPFSLGAAKGKFGMIGPPQLDAKAAAELACRHIQGFFALITSPDPTIRDGTRLLPPDCFFHDAPYSYRDWGNPRLLEVVQRVQSWKRLGVVTTAQGFFQAEFRRDEGDTGQWFWALEWNKCTRLIGVIKKPEDALPLFQQLPEVEWRRVSSHERLRFEQSLPTNQPDLLFDCE